MTEEIIIDGINVAGCYWKCKDGDCAMYYADLSADNNELEFGFNCEDNPDCYYKQLKRLEQENKELRQQYNCYACDTCQGKEDYRNMKRHCENAIKTVHAYRSALEEIKEFAEPIYEQIPDDKVLRQILLKISEVLK